MQHVNASKNRMNDCHYRWVTDYAPSDSLVQYGDGLFETMLANPKRIYRFDVHWARLVRGLRALQMPVPEENTFKQTIWQALQTHFLEKNQMSDTPPPLAVLKLTVSRGAGLRGYKTYENPELYAQLSISDYHLPIEVKTGARVAFCSLRLAAQTQLAGIKHNNRLEYVLARRALSAQHTTCFEGLLCNQDGDLQEGLISNVWLYQKGVWHTPALLYSGVHGTVRAALLSYFQQQKIRYRVRRIHAEEVFSADAIALSNAAFGIIAVHALANQSFDCAPVFALQKTLDHPCADFHPSQ